MREIHIFIFVSIVNSGLCNGLQRAPPPSILDGENFVTDNNFHLSLKHKGVHVCSATLLNTEYDKVIAITAASCLPSQKPAEYSLSFGKVLVGEDADEYCILTKIRLYEEFDKKTLDNDVALLLSVDITKTGSCGNLINATLGVILANSTTPRLNLKVTGWDDTTDTLKAIENVVASGSDVCNDRILTEKNLTIGSTMVCHGVSTKDKELGKCRAERGSPVVADIPESPPVLVAVTSWTLMTEYMDDSSYPCVGTGMFDDAIKSWIENEIEDFAIG